MCVRVLCSVLLLLNGFLSNVNGIGEKTIYCVLNVVPAERSTLFNWEKKE